MTITKVTNEGTRLDRAFAVLVGQVAGDSLGAQVEFRGAHSINQQYPLPKGLREMVGGGPHGILPGQATDDSELALALARSLAQEGEFVEESVAASYVDWLLSHPFDCGGTCGTALGGVDVGRQIAPQVKKNAMKKLDSQANGSLMRASPLGILFARKLADGADHLDLAKIARNDSLLTHAHKRCQQAVAIHTLAIARLINSPLAREERRQDAFEFAVSVNNEEDSEENAWVAQTLFDAKTKPTDDGKTAEPQVGWVKWGFQNAFHQLLHAPSFEEGIVRTIALGGDSDTNAAIAGGLLGALFGISGQDPIPTDWKTKVLKCRSRRPSTYHADDAEDLSRKILLGD